MRAVTLAALLCTACGAAADLPGGITYTGLPADTAQLTAIATGYAQALGYTGRLAGTVDLRPAADFAACSLANPDGCPNEFGPAANFVIVLQHTGDTAADIAASSWVHELTHAMRGDPGHADPTLWGADGTVRRYNAQLATP